MVAEGRALLCHSVRVQLEPMGTGVGKREQGLQVHDLLSFYSAPALRAHPVPDLMESCPGGLSAPRQQSV